MTTNPLAARLEAMAAEFRVAESLAARMGYASTEVEARESAETCRQAASELRGKMTEEMREIAQAIVWAMQDCKDKDGKPCDAHMICFGHDAYEAAKAFVDANPPLTAALDG